MASPSALYFSIDMAESQFAPEILDFCSADTALEQSPSALAKGQRRESAAL